MLSFLSQKILEKSPKLILSINHKHSTMSSKHPLLRYLTQKEAQFIDSELMGKYDFSIDQLMELAGLGVATAIAKCYPLPKYNRPIICCGPGNNGGDGLVCARHLKQFGYSPVIICPKPGKGELYQRLIKQCTKFGINILPHLPEEVEVSKEIGEQNWFGNLVIDAVFGFSFTPPNKNPEIAKLLNMMHKLSQNAPLASIDIPSGWHVEEGDTDKYQEDIEPDLKLPILQPECLISLTAPKLCAQKFKGRYHYLAGRFCPDAIQIQYRLNLPEYKGTDGCILLN